MPQLELQQTWPPEHVFLPQATPTPRPVGSGMVFGWVGLVMVLVRGGRGPVLVVVVGTGGPSRWPQSCIVHTMPGAVHMLQVGLQQTWFPVHVVCPQAVACNCVVASSVPSMGEALTMDEATAAKARRREETSILKPLLVFIAEWGFFWKTRLLKIGLRLGSASTTEFEV